jgi:tetratricopeptide (TPR) repeat protein
MLLELNLHFPDSQHIIVSLNTDNGREETDLLDFSSPFSEKDFKKIRWYLENYATEYSTDIDIQSADSIAKKLPLVGNVLFNKVFATRHAQRLFKKFRDQHELGRLVTITADDPTIFSLPWELLHPANKGGQFLINEMPRISIRRRTHGKKAFEIKLQTQAHILFVVSRPQNVGMVNPPASAQAVLNALGKNKRVTVEFLRPATLKKLRERLTNKELPHVDIVHFYGPSRQDASLIKQAKADLKSLPATLTSEASNIELTQETTYLFLEKDNGDPFIVPTPLFANILNRYQVPLVILSACRWARVGHKEDVDSVAAELSANGIPFVLAIRYWMLKPATQILFQTFYQGLAQGKKIGAALHTARLALYEKNERREILSQKGLFKINLYDWFSPVLYQLGQDTALLTKVKSEDLSESTQENQFSSNNLPIQPRAGFFGRGPELWEIERCFMRGRRRLILSSFAAGQGKTCLAQEAGRWLQRTGLFKRVVFIDYANYQGLNPVSVAVSTIANVLHKNLLDADAATQALRRVPTLLIFDNVDAIGTAATAAESLPSFTDKVEEKTTEPSLILEDSVFNDDGLPKLILEPETETKESNQKLILSDEAEPKIDAEDQTFSFEQSEVAKTPEEQLEDEQIQLDGFSQLLEAANKWSQTGQSGVIFITRNPNFNLRDFSDKGSLQTGKLFLDKLDKNAALHYFEALMILPPNSRFGMPKRAEVESLFEKVGYHPLSINMLAFALKNEPVETVTKRLDNLLTNQNSAENPEHSLQASLKLFVEQLEPKLRQHLPKLGIFKGGAFENVLQAITEIPQEIWQKLRDALESVNLIQAENFEGVKVPYLNFHPTLAPTLWTGLSSKEQKQLKERYSHGYQEFSEFLYNLENPYQARFIEQRELPNLLQAAYESLDTGKAWALGFADKVKSFLADFGLKSDDKKFIELNDDSNNNCDCDWFTKKSEEADEYYSRCQYLEAQEAYEDILEALKDQEPNYDSSVALGWIGRCMAEHGKFDEAIERFRKTLSELAKLETSPLVERQQATIQSYLAAVLKEKGDTSTAITAYEKALSMMKAIKDQHQEAVMETEIALLLISQDDLVKAERFLHHALGLFKSLNQPEFEAETWSYLGNLYTKAKQWKAAIQAHTKAANLFEAETVYSSAAENWEKLAEINESLGNQQDADIAYMKAIKSYKATIDKNPDDATLLLETYEHLAEITEKHKDTVQAQKYRRLAQQLPQSTTTTTQTCPDLDKHKHFIDAVVATVGHPGLRTQLDTMLEQRESKGWHSLITAIRRLLNGERDEDNLIESEDLDSEDSGIVHEILSRIENAKEKEMSLL